MARFLIECRQLTKVYGQVRAVDGIDLAVAAGEMFGLIGHNGAGKSTLMKMMLGLVPPTSGEIRVDGRAVRGEAFREVRRRVGYLPESLVLYDNLTGLETLHFFAGLKRVPRSECAPLLERVGLSEAAARRVRGYSKGMRQRLGFAQALLGHPVLLILDEPTTGVDPEGIRDFYRIVREMQLAGATIMLSSHILSEVQERVDRLAVIKAGRIQALGTVESLRAEMNLSLRVDVRFADRAGPALRQALAALDVGDIDIEGDCLTLRCPRATKMALLRTLSSFEGRVLDVHVREPSLEDMFLARPGD